MTDYTYEEVDGYYIFDGYWNWQEEPSEKLDIQVASNIYSGTVHSIRFNRDPVRRINYKILDVETKLYAFLLFWADRIGRYKAFWMPDKFQRFTPLSIAVDRSTMEIVKQPNLYLQATDRLFIRLYDGTRYICPIDSVTQLTSTTQISFLAPLPDEFIFSDIEFASLLFLVRFDQDEIEIECHSENAASVNLSFIELLHEYEEN